MKRIHFISFILITSIIIGCNNNRQDCEGTSPELLANRFYSYQSINDFEAEIKKTNGSIIVIENSSLPEFDQRPAFNIYTILIPNHSLLGFKGKLRASFFNNRLVSIWFYPETQEEYIEEINKTSNINLIDKKELNINCMKVHRWKDFNDEFYVGWTDARLDQELNDWIIKYS